MAAAAAIWPSASHRSHWLAGQDKLSGIDGNPFHPHQEHMIPAAGVQDQELSVGSERTRVNDEPVARGCDLGAGPGRDGKALFGPSHAVRVAEIPDFNPVNR